MRQRCWLAANTWKGSAIASRGRDGVQAGSVALVEITRDGVDPPRTSSPSMQPTTDVNGPVSLIMSEARGDRG